MPHGGAEKGLGPRLRRARRDDIGVLAAVTGGPEAGRIRCLRRILGSLASDVYLALDGAGPRGVVMVAYHRSIARGGLVGTVDVLASLDPPGAVLSREVGGLLLDCVLERARRRGCVSIEAACEDEGLSALFASAGFEGFAARRSLPLRIGDATKVGGSGRRPEPGES